MQDIAEEEKYWLWLASVEGIGPVRFYHVLNTFTDIKSAWENCTEITRCVKGINEKMGAKSVSYTHLDVYKRQAQYQSFADLSAG